jgi:hypothetical protein
MKKPEGCLLLANKILKNCLPKPLHHPVLIPSCGCRACLPGLSCRAARLAAPAAAGPHICSPQWAALGSAASHQAPRLWHWQR